MLNGCSMFYTPHFLKMPYALLYSKCISSSQLDKYLEQTSCMPYILPFVHKKHNIAMKFHPFMSIIFVLYNFGKAKYY